MRKKLLFGLLIIVCCLLSLSMLGCSEEENVFTCENGDLLLLSDDNTVCLTTEEEVHLYEGVYQMQNSACILTLTQMDGTLLAEVKTVYISVQDKTFTYIDVPAPGPDPEPSTENQETVCMHILTQTERRNYKACTCTEDGYTGDVYCCACGTLIREGSVIDRHGHFFTVETSEADNNAVYSQRKCCQNEIRFFKCSVCGVVSTDVKDTYEVSGTADPRLHSYTVQSDEVCVAATCSTAGSNYLCCSGCGKISSYTYVVPATGEHDYSLKSDEYLKTNADCGHNAVYYYTCSVCHEPSPTLTYEKEGTKTLNHSFTVASGQVKSEANCTSDRVEYASCAVCGMTDTDYTVTIPDTKNGVHKFTAESDVVASEATCTRSRYNYCRCEFCGLVSTVKTYAVSATAHGHSYDGHICTECGKVEDTSMIWDISEDGKTDCVQVSFFKDAGVQYYKVIVAGSGNMLNLAETTAIPWYKYIASIGSVNIVGAAPISDTVRLYTGVTSVGDRCFSGCSNLTSVTLAGTVTRIGSYSFAHCTKLEDITFPSSISAIQKGAFAECEKIKNVDLSCCSTLQTVGYSAFEKCSSLEEVNLSGTQITALADSTFADCSVLSKVTLPSGIRKIGDYAFYNTFAGLEKVGVLAEEEKIFEVENSDYFYTTSTVFSATEVGERDETQSTFTVNSHTYTFSGTDVFDGGVQVDDARYSDTLITFPDKKYYCKDNSLYPEVGSIDLAAKVLTIASTEYFINDNIYKYVGWNGETLTSLTEIGTSAFASCAYLASITLPSSLLSLGDTVFENDVLLASLSFGDNLTSIGKNIVNGTAYYNSVSAWNDDHILTVALSNGSSFYTIGSAVEDHFGTVKNPSGNPSSKKYYENVNGEYTLSQDTKVSSGKTYYQKISKTSTSIFMDSCRLIADGAFDACVKLTDITTNALYIGKEAFRSCISLKSVALSSTKAVGESAFSKCAALRNVSLPATLQTIGDEAFSYCTQLRSLSIQVDQNKIGQNILLGDHLFELYTKTGGYENETVPVVHTDSFSEDSVVTSDGTYTFAYVENKGYLIGITTPEAVSLTLPDSFTIRQGENDVDVNSYEIYDYAFYNDVYESQFVTVTVSSSVTAIGECAFKNCSALETINIPTSVQSIGKNAFVHTRYYDTSSNWQNSVLYLSSSDVDHSYILLSAEPGVGVTLKELSVLSGTYLIADEALILCKDLSILEMPASVQNVGKNILKGNQTITTLRVPFVGATENSETYLAYYFGGISYEDNTSAELIPSSLYSVSVTVASTIPANAFKDCSYLTVIVLKKADTVGENAFYNCSEAVISLNDQIKSVGSHAFYNCKNLTEITFEEIETVPEYAFSGSGLLTVSFPEETTTIETGAFENCYLLYSLVIGSNITEIKENAFSGDIGLVQVKFAAGSKALTVGENAFLDCKKLVEIDASKRSSMTDLEIGTDSYGSLAKYAIHLVKDISPTILKLDNGFYRAYYNKTYYLIGYTLLNEKVELPEKYSTEQEKYLIYSYAFAKNYRITSINIGSAVTVIGKEAFAGCNNLKTVTLSTTLTTVSEGAFMSTPLVSVNFVSQSGTGSRVNGVSTIKEEAFLNCTELKSVTFGNSVTTIGKSAFSGCTGLTKVVMPTNLATIGQNAFDGCSSLQELDMASVTLQSMGQGVFNNCPVLERLTWRTTVSLAAPTTMETYGYFVGSGNKMRVTFTERVAQVPAYLFYVKGYTDDKIPSVSSLTFTENTEVIGAYAFYKLAVSSVTLPSSLTDIDEYAFAESSISGDILLPESLQGLGTGAFMNCSGITSIKYEGKVLTEIPTDTFAGCSSLYYVALSESVSSLKQDSFYQCTSLSTIVLGMSLVESDIEAFSGCVALQNVYIVHKKAEDMEEADRTAWENGHTLYFVYFDENISATVKRSSTITVHIDGASTDEITTVYTSSQTGILYVSNKNTGSIYGASAGTAEYTVTITVPVQKGDKTGKGTFTLSCQVTVK